MRKAMNRNARGLGKYDAPLKVQYQQGYYAFKRGGQINPFHTDTMQFREWNRGYDKAYYENLTKVKKDEQLREGRKEFHGGQVQHV